MKAQMLSVDEYIQVMKNVKGCQFVSIKYLTNREALNKKLVGGKKNPYYGRVACLTSITSTQVGANYQNAVNNRLKGDGQGEGFVAESLPWGEWIRPNYLIGHKGETYVRLYLTKSSKTEKKYYIDGRLATEDESKAIANEIREHSVSVRQSEVGICEENQVKPININVKNINSIVMNGNAYNIVSVIL